MSSLFNFLFPQHDILFIKAWMLREIILLDLENRCKPISREWRKCTVQSRNRLTDAICQRQCSRKNVAMAERRIVVERPALLSPLPAQVLCPPVGRRRPRLGCADVEADILLLPRESPECPKTTPAVCLSFALVPVRKSFDCPACLSALGYFQVSITAQSTRVWEGSEKEWGGKVWRSFWRIIGGLSFVVRWLFDYSDSI